MAYKNKDEYNNYMRDYMLRRYYERIAYARAYLGNQCAKCGYDEHLEFDHADRATKEFSMGSRLAGIAQSKVDSEIEKLQLLCEVCHRDKTQKELSKSVCKRGHARTPENVTKTRACKACMREYYRKNH